MTSGGASRIVEPWVSLASTPKAASRSQTARPGSDANSYVLFDADTGRATVAQINSKDPLAALERVSDR